MIRCFLISWLRCWRLDNTHTQDYIEKLTWLADPLALCFCLTLSRFLVHTHQAFITLPQVVPCSSAALSGFFCTCRAAAADACSYTTLTLEPQCSSWRTVDALTGWTVQGLESARSAPYTTHDSRCSTNHTEIVQGSVTHDGIKWPEPSPAFLI